MEKREPSFLKDRPDPKRPKTPLALRSDSLDAEESSKMAFGVKLLQDFDITQFPTKTDFLGRYFFKRKKSPKSSMQSITDLLFDELVVIYNKGIDIPTPTKQKKKLCNAYQQPY